jgi:hypothetical protein
LSQTHYFSENLVALGMKPRTLNQQLGTLTTEAVTYSSKNDKFDLLTADSRGARISTGYRLGEGSDFESQQGQEFFTSPYL